MANLSLQQILLNSSDEPGKCSICYNCYSWTNPVIMNQYCKHLICLNCKNLHIPVKCMHGGCGGGANFQLSNELTQAALGTVAPVTNDKITVKVRGINGKTIEAVMWPTNTYAQLNKKLEDERGARIPQVTVGKTNFRLDKEGNKTLQDMGIKDQTLVITTARFDGGQVLSAPQ